MSTTAVDRKAEPEGASDDPARAAGTPAREDRIAGLVARLDAVRLAWLAAGIYVLAFAARLPIALTRRLDGDEAVQGIAALRLVDDGRFSWFYPGQKHGGTLETIPQGLLQLIDSGNVFLLRLPIVLIAAGAVLVLALLALELTQSRLTFLAAGVLASVFPPVFVFLGSWQTAGYNASTLLAALAVYLFARALRPALSERRRSILIGAAGLSVGLAFYEQPMAVFLVAALGTTVLVALWSRVVQHLRLRHLAILGGLALLGASPEIVGVFSGLDSNNVYDPLPADYHLTPRLLLAVGGLDLFGNPASLPQIGFPGGYESMFWNALGLEWLGNLIVPRLVAVGIAAAVWIWLLATVARSVARRRMGPAEQAGARLLAAVAAGALVAALVVSLTVTRLPPLSKYSFGLTGFAAFALAIVATQAPLRHRASAWLLGVGIAGLVAASLTTTIGSSISGQDDPVHQQRTWLLNQIEAVPLASGQAKVLYGDYWIAYPLDFMSGDRFQASVPEFNRFSEPEGAGEVPAGQVIVPIVPDLPFQSEVESNIREQCATRSTETEGEATMLVAECR